MKDQLFVGGGKPSAQCIKPCKRDDLTLNNKPRGGFWTSTYHPRLGSDWIQWCLSENFYAQDSGILGCWLLHVEPSAKIFTINSYKDLEQINQKFPHREKLVPIDFESASKWCDAIHLTKRGQHETRYGYPLNLYGWDCESTLWFNFKFSTVEHIGLMKRGVNGNTIQ